MKKYLVGTENGILLINGVELTTEVNKATAFDKIGDAMKECIRLNNINLGFTTLFRVIPIG